MFFVLICYALYGKLLQEFTFCGKMGGCTCNPFCNWSLLGWFGTTVLVTLVSEMVEL